MKIFLPLLIFALGIIDELIKKKIYAIEGTVPCLNYMQEKFSLAWVKENMGIQPKKNIPEKILWRKKNSVKWNNSKQ